ncbi:LacI family transcriptional regulator [Frondihabitans sucicola]|uniref:LacI family transcriptional regulator n=1 Tax=Frondihabitans sucicola TaxID=1268041 RepID=A0ABN6Y0U9_9MICO|nr:LacI family DNA-binding transcriptional regulator [Frondihabitans sucicola]BDZ50967.1 LacI family transcriptional regulator [Frondihabitans sucicola]
MTVEKIPARVTIVDVARRAGVSKGAASHALNGRAGVSEETRTRVKSAAADLGWSPNGTARALSGARAGAIGWAILRTPKSSTIDPYFTELFAGIELELATTELALVVKLVADRAEEEALYRRWASERRVDGVLLTDIDTHEKRFALLDELHLPVASFRSRQTGPPTADEVPSVWMSESPGAERLLDAAYDLGHRSIGWISGSASKSAVVVRDRAASAWGARRGARVVTRFTDYSTGEGTAAAASLLSEADPPTFIVFDNDLMALAGLSTCHSLGLQVPDDVSIASFIDSDLCSIAVPPLTALRHSTIEFGRILTRRLLQVLDGGEVVDVELPGLELVLRGSVGPVRH